MLTLFINLRSGIHRRSVHYYLLWIAICEKQPESSYYKSFQHLQNQMYVWGQMLPHSAMGNNTMLALLLVSLITQCEIEYAVPIRRPYVLYSPNPLWIKLNTALQLIERENK